MLMKKRKLVSIAWANGALTRSWEADVTSVAAGGTPTVEWQPP